MDFNGRDLGLPERNTQRNKSNDNADVQELKTRNGGNIPEHKTTIRQFRRPSRQKVNPSTGCTQSRSDGELHLEKIRTQGGHNIRPHAQ